MKGRAIRQLVTTGDPARRGAVHGAAYHNEIRHYTAERVRLAADGSWAGRTASAADALALAEEMLPAHRRYAPDLYLEMEQMALAGGISPAEAVIVGGFTDFVDVVRAMGGQDLPEEDDCTAVMVAAPATDGPGFLAQTWDMHESATSHVTMMRVEPDEGPGSLLFTTVGCLGQIGMNEAGIAVGINNLTAVDGKVGVTWPFVIRKILQQVNLEDALACVLEADLAGAHNYLLFDRHGDGYNVESMPSYRATTALGEEPLVHTNHSLDAGAQRLESSRPADLQASSEDRLAKATEMLSVRPVTLESLIEMTREPEVICRRSTPPYHNESSGAAIMRPSTGDFWACWGPPAENDFEHLQIEPVPDPEMVFTRRYGSLAR